MNEERATPPITVQDALGEIADRLTLTQTSTSNMATNFGSMVVHVDELIAHVDALVANLDFS